jgi:hypothetical protein
MGHDAVVSTVGLTAVDGQKIIIDAAIAAGVKHFIPSEYGSCTTSPELSELPLYSSATRIRQYLGEKASEDALSYTVLATGVFLDIVLSGPALLDFDKHTAVLFDGGNNRLSASSLDAVGRGITGILNNLDKTQNRTVFISQTILTQNELLGFAKEVQPDTKWSTSTLTSRDLLQQGLAAFASGDTNLPSVMKVLSGTALAGDRYGSAYDETDNELLGIQLIAPTELKSLIAKRLG